MTTVKPSVKLDVQPPYILKRIFAIDGSPLHAQRKLVIPMLALVVSGLLGIALVHAGLTSPKALVAGVLLLAATAFIAAVFLTQRREGVPTLVIDRNGIDHAWFGRIPWGDVLYAGPRRINPKGGKAQLLVLAVASPGRFTRRIRPLVRSFQSLGKFDNAARGEFVIPIGGLDVPSERITAAVRVYRSAVSPPPLAFWWMGMDEESFCKAADFGKKEAELHAMVDALPAHERADFEDQLLLSLKAEGIIRR